jgi:NADH-quinone oxidoreductase subunit J
MEAALAGGAAELGGHCIPDRVDESMNVPVIMFFACALLAVFGAVLLILAKEPIHSALALILVMAALAVLYLLLGAEFIAAVQLIVYAGAIMVLFVFVIMLLNAGVEDRTNQSLMAKYLGLPLSGFLVLDLAWWIARSTSGKAELTASAVPAQASSTIELSNLLFKQFLFPFEATSILILIAMVGAVVLARRDP